MSTGYGIKITAGNVGEFVFGDDVRLVPSQYSTIQAAIDACDGVTPTTILLMPGTYTENIVLKSHVSLIGADRDTCIISGNNGPVVTMSNYTVLANVSVNAVSGMAVHVYKNAGTLTDIDIRSCKIRCKHWCVKAETITANETISKLRIRNCQLIAQNPICFKGAVKDSLVAYNSMYCDSVETGASFAPFDLSSVLLSSNPEIVYSYAENNVITHNAFYLKSGNSSSVWPRFAHVGGGNNVISDNVGFLHITAGTASDATFIHMEPGAAGLLPNRISKNNVTITNDGTSDIHLYGVYGNIMGCGASLVVEGNIFDWQSSVAPGIITKIFYQQTDGANIPTITCRNTFPVILLLAELAISYATYIGDEELQKYKLPKNIGELTIGDVVYIGASGCELARANSASTANAVGIVAKNAEFSDTVVIVAISGILKNTAWSLTPGATYYVSTSTAGALQATRPTSSGHFIKQVGVAISADELLIECSGAYIAIP